MRSHARKLAASLAAVPAALGLTASSPATATATATPIRHVVVIYLENHSFDSLLGWFCADNRAEGGSRCLDAQGQYAGMPLSVPLAGGATVQPGTTPDMVPVVNHQTADQVAAIDGGRMDGWASISGCAAPQYACVSGYQPYQEPNLATLAAKYAISDATFSMQDSPSWFGHLYAVAASTDGFTGTNPFPPAGSTAPKGKGWGCDSNRVTAWAPSPGAATSNQPSCVPDPGLPLANGGAFKATKAAWEPTIMDRLDAAGLPWRIYGAQCATEAPSTSPGLETCTKMNPGGMGYDWSICPSFADCLYTSQASSLVPDSQFAADAAAGSLPAFSVVTPGDATVSEHNGFSMAKGDNWLGQQVAAVMGGPDWASTAIFITWDDCGCFYDQAVPGTNPDGTPQGPRVPLVIVSPYARPGYTDTTPATFASILAYTEQNFGLKALGVNDAGAYPFTNAFDYSQAPLSPARMVTRPVPAGERVNWAQARQGS